MNEEQLNKGIKLEKKIVELKNRIEILKAGHTRLDQNYQFSVAGCNINDPYLSPSVKKTILIIAIAEHEQALERLETEFAAL